MATRALLALVVLAASCVAAGTSAQPQRPPNIVVIVADDMGYADIGAHGSRDMLTPNIDALARDGVRFTDAYVSGPYCSPTRAGFLTGRYPQRFGHEFNLAPVHAEFGLPLEETTIADRLKTAGYRTAIFGKWHLGMGEKYHPLRRGFEEFFGFLAGAHPYINVGPASNRLLEGTTPLESFDGYLTDTLAERASAYVKQQASKPFFLYLAFNAAHTPLQASKKYLDRFPHIQNEQRRSYAAMVSAMDDGIGKVLGTLREQNLDQNTLVIFFNDNGGPTMATTSVNGSSNAPLRGSKRTTWEGGIRVPFMIRWTGRLTAGRVDRRPIIQLDVLPTALAAAGVNAGKSPQLDGVDLLPFLSGVAKGLPHETLYWRMGGMMAIRHGDWKLVKTREGVFVDPDPAVLSDLAGAELYDLAADIGESKNLAAARPEKVKELGDRWQLWNKQLVKPRWGPPPPGGGGQPR
jgi:arylsulfatase A-like enzyme